MEKRCNCDALRKLARQAKNRLSGREKEKGDYKVYSGGFIADYKLVLLSNKEDERFYARVSEMLRENVDTINPLGQLVDKPRFALMSDLERERYIITLADKYLKMKERYRRENSVLEYEVG
jgi:hypothetical protein